MNDYRKLIDAYLDGEMTGEMEKRLLDWLRETPENVRIFVRETHAHRALRDSLVAGLIEEQIENGHPEAARDARDAGQPVRKSTRRSVRHEAMKGPKGGTYGRAAAIAAGFLIGLAILLTLTSRTGRSGLAERGRTRPPGSKEVEDRQLGDEDRREAAERRQAEERLREIERERGRLLAKPLTPEEKPAPEQVAKREKALAELEDRKRLIEQEMREAIEREQKARVLVERAPEKAPTARPPGPPAPAPQGTKASVAKVERLSGQGFLLAGDERKPLEAGLELRAGQGLEVGEKGHLVVLYPDLTRVHMMGPTTVRELNAEGGKRVIIERGTVGAEVAKQPKEHPMVFVTPHGEAMVVGTTLRIEVDSDPKKGTRLDVEEGRVQLKNLAGKTVDVPSGHYAVAAVGVELAARPIRTPEILLLPYQGKIIGETWRLVKDEKASTGIALEAPAQHKITGGPEEVTREPSWVAFTFWAEGNRTYSLWVRGRCMASENPGLYDCVGLELRSATMVGQYKATPIPSYAEINGFARPPGYPGYGWVGGNADFYNDKGQFIPGDAAGNPKAHQGDVVPISVRFSRSGIQTLKLFAVDSPMRIDAIWFSTTQKSRPAPEVPAPKSTPGK